MEIVNKQDKGYIAVWLTNEEQQLYDRSKLTSLLLNKADFPKCRIVYFSQEAKTCAKIWKGFCLQI